MQRHFLYWLKRQWFKSTVDASLILISCSQKTTWLLDTFYKHNLILKLHHSQLDGAVGLWKPVKFWISFLVGKKIPGFLELCRQQTIWYQNPLISLNSFFILKKQRRTVFACFSSKWHHWWQIASLDKEHSFCNAQPKIVSVSQLNYYLCQVI